MANHRRRLERLIAHFEEQGCKVRTTGEGWYVQFPPPADGSKPRGTSVHRSNSDNRAMKNLRSQFLRAGVEWPDWATHF